MNGAGKMAREYDHKGKKTTEGKDKVFSLLKTHLLTFFSGSFLKNYFIVAQLQLSAFSPHPSTPPQPNPPPSPASTLPLGFVHVSL